MTNFIIYAFLVFFLLLVIHLLSLNSVQIVPNRFSIGIEAINGFLHNLVKEQMGSKNEMFFPFIYSLFMFILLSNLVANVPYNFCISASAIYSLGLSFTIFIGVTFLSVYIYGLQFFSRFVPEGSPLAIAPALSEVELISYVARAFSLGIRLFSNLIAGHTLLKILSGFLYPILNKSAFIFVAGLLPLALFTALVGLEIGVSVIQAYVFTLLTSSYIKEALILH